MTRTRSLAVLAMASAMTAAACTGHTTRRQTAPTPDRTPVSCATAVVNGPLPTWAQAGFTPPTVAVPHVLAANGDIVGVLFGYPLRSPPRPDRRNKVLWLSRVPSNGDPLKIQAKLSGSTLVAIREVAGGPGPSYIDLPRPGCWHLTLSWSGHRDRMNIPYSAG